MDASMMRVALTGGIATGKTHVLSRLAENGIRTIDADDIVHEMLGTDSPTTREIAAEFGRDVVNATGAIDRAALGRKVFADPESRRRLEAIIHPGVYDAIEKWYRTLDRTVGVASIPLLFETHHESDFEFVVVTTCRPDQQLQRILDRGGISEVEARQRIAAQLPQAEKVRRADFVIDTSGARADTDSQIHQLLRSISRLQDR